MPEDCTAYFPDPKYADSHSDGGNSVRALFKAVSGNNSKQHPCAVLGPLEVDATFNLRSILRALDIPLIVHYVENDLLASKATESPATVTMSLSAKARARAIVEFLHSREFLASLSTSSQSQDILLSESVEQLGKELYNLGVALFVDVEPPPNVDEGEHIRQSLQRLKDNGITTILLSAIQEPYKLPQFAIYLEQLNMLVRARTGP